MREKLRVMKAGFREDISQTINDKLLVFKINI